MFKSLSTSLIVRGLLAVAVGIMALAWPQVTVLALVILFAVYAFIAAGLEAMRAFSSPSAGPVAGHLLLGLVDLAAGVVALAWPGPTALVLVLIVGSWAVIAGVVEIAAAFAAGEPAGTRTLFILGGLVSIAFGAVLFARPGVGRDHPGPAVRPVQPGLRGLGPGAGHRAAPDRQDHPLRVHRKGEARRPDPVARPSQADGRQRCAAGPAGYAGPPRPAARRWRTTMAKMAAAGGGPGASRLDRRKARTRQALIDAAVRLIAEGRGERASIAEITEEADIGFGSFYNHFGSKEQLFGTASGELLEQWGQVIDQACADISDPAEVFAVALRISGRLGWTHPDIARFLTGVGLEALDASRGLAPRALRDIRAGQAAGRFTVTDAEIALSAVAGGLFGLLRLRERHPERVDETSVDQLTEACLRLLGIPAAEAVRLVASSLPPVGAVSR